MTTTQDNIQRLAQMAPARDPLNGSEIPDPILKKTGFGAASSGGGGISSPLTETLYTDREYYTVYTLASTDGLFVLELKRIKKMKFVDADGRNIEMKFSDV